VIIIWVLGHKLAIHALATYVANISSRSSYINWQVLTNIFSGILKMALVVQSSFKSVVAMLDKTIANVFFFSDLIPVSNK